MNKMPELAKLQDLEIGEQFEIKVNNETYNCAFLETGLFEVDADGKALRSLNKYIAGIFAEFIPMKKRPWVPKDKDIVFVYDNGFVRETGVDASSVLTLAMIAQGMVFRTEAEATTIGKERFDELMKKYENGTIVEAE